MAGGQSEIPEGGQWPEGPEGAGQGLNKREPLPAQLGAPAPSSALLTVSDLQPRMKVVWGGRSQETALSAT